MNFIVPFSIVDKLKTGDSTLLYLSIEVEVSLLHTPQRKEDPVKAAAFSISACRCDDGIDTGSPFLNSKLL